MQTAKRIKMIYNNLTFNYYEDFIGFDKDKEFLPKDFDTFNSQIKHRQLFLNLSNNVLKEICSFNKYEQKFYANYSLKSTFETKIKNLLPNSCIKIRKNERLSFNFCQNSTNIINNYLNPTKNIKLIVTKNIVIPAAKLISLCYINNNIQLLIDKHLLFHEFVLKKIKKMHSDKTVIDLGDSICIKTKDFHGVKIYTSWKDIEIKKPNIQNELEGAINSIKKGEYYQIFLAYPKTNEFKKQIPVFVDELKNKEYQIKAIPYSLRSTIKN